MITMILLLAKIVGMILFYLPYVLFAIFGIFVCYAFINSKWFEK